MSRTASFLDKYNERKDHLSLIGYEAKERIDMDKIEVGGKVAFNTNNDATWFRVEKIDGYNLIVREDGVTFEGEIYHEQNADRSLVKQVRSAVQIKIQDAVVARLYQDYPVLAPLVRKQFDQGLLFTEVLNSLYDVSNTFKEVWTEVTKETRGS